jgi:hypothetical protein
MTGSTPFRHEPWRIEYLLTIFEFNTLCLKISRNGKNDRVVLIEWGAFNTSESVNSWNFLYEAMEISSKLDRTMPFLEREPAVNASALKFRVGKEVLKLTSKRT